MILVEDKGLKETFYKEIEITIDLFEDGNYIIIIPIFNETNIIQEKYMSYKDFEFKKIKNKKEKEKILLFILIPIIIVIIIIIFAIIFYIKHKNRNNKEITAKNILDEELTSIDK